MRRSKSREKMKIESNKTSKTTPCLTKKMKRCKKKVLSLKRQKKRGRLP